MLLNSDKGDQLNSLKHGEAGLFDELNVVLDLLLVGLSGFLEGINLTGGLKLNESLSDLSGPSHLCSSDQNLTLSRADNLKELVALWELLSCGHVVSVELVEDVLESFSHGLKESLKPRLDSGIDNNRLTKVNDFLLN